MLATTWVQIIKAVMLLSGATFMAFMVMKAVGFSFSNMFTQSIEVFSKVHNISLEDAAKLWVLVNLLQTQLMLYLLV